MRSAALIFKIAPLPEWREAVAGGSYEGSDDDRRDGFIHLSASHQVAGTLARHFRARKNLVLIAFRADDLTAGLRWEAARGGDFFPHHYGPLDARLALWMRAIAEEGGGHILPPLGGAE